MIHLVPIFILAQTTTSVQKDLDAMYLKWDKAVVAHDRRTMDSVLASGFAAKLKGAKKPMTKSEFLGAITGRWKPDSPREQSFVTKIKKVEMKSSLAVATILESVVFKMKDGKTRKVDFHSLDTWQRVGKGWQIIATESLD
jgi:hypothetical protein